MYLFIGDKENGYFADEIIRQQGEKIAYIRKSFHINKQITEIIQYKTCSHMIFDLSQYLDDPGEIVSEIKKIQNTNNAEVTIFAEGFVKTADLIIRLHKEGITNFIFDSKLDVQMQELIKCINGYYKKNSIISDEELEVIEKEVVKNHRVHVAVAGSMNRIGTTTQTMQLIKCLQLKGKSVCYIQMNDTKFVDGLKKYYVVQKENSDLGYLRVENVDIYYKKDKIHEILQESYEYFVYDYGWYQHTNFNKISFLEKEIQVIVLGIKPSELEQSIDILGSKFYTATNFIFNYADDNQADDIKELTKNNSKVYTCNTYITDCFKFSNNLIYVDILNVKKLKDIKVKGKKRLFWRIKNA